MSPVLVIGSNSFSGSSFIDFLLSNGLNVVGLSRGNESADVMLPYKWNSHGNFKFHQMDLNKDLDLIVDLVSSERPEYIVNFAAQSMVGESWEYPEDWFMTNVVSSVKLHNALRKMNMLKRYVHVSTPEVYGSCEGFVSEDFPFNPSTPYAVSRAAADMSLKTFYAAHNFPVVTTRAANVYGPGQQLYRIIPRTIFFVLTGRKIQLHGGGLSTRSFIHMRDVSDATWKIAQHGRSGDAYHISTNEIISIRNLVEKICSKLDANFEDHVELVGDRLGKDLAYHLDSSKVRNELGWESAITLDTGIDETIKWVRNNLDSLCNQPTNYIHKP